VRPDAPLVIGAALDTLDELASERTDPGEILRLRSVATVLRVLGQEWDDGVAKRVAAIGCYRRALGGARPLLGGDLASRLDRQLEEPDPSHLDLRISALDRTLDGLRSSVIEVQIALEAAGTDGGEARARLWKAADDDAAMDDRHGAFW
jgi:hypothetical protein